MSHNGNRPQVDTGESATLDMGTSAYGVIWTAQPSTRAGAYPGSLQIVWDGADAVDGSVSWEISNDGHHWTTWAGSLAVDNSLVTSVDITTGAGTQIWEVTHWTARYFRIKYEAGTNTTGTLEYRIYKTK
jgi:hypothetical protein